MRNQVRLYRSSNYDEWFAFSRACGWVTFPAETNGWKKRKAARGLSPVGLREVPLCMGFNTGIPGAPRAVVSRTAAAILAA